jgi:tRNA (uracil-5-)-methyltransferase
MAHTDDSALPFRISPEATAATIIGDEPFQLSYMAYDSDKYEAFLQAKLVLLTDKFRSNLPAFYDNYNTGNGLEVSAIAPDGASLDGTSEGEGPGVSGEHHENDWLRRVDVIRSPRKHSRQKCRFAVFEMQQHEQHEQQEHGDTVLMGRPRPLVYTFFEGGGPNVVVRSFPIASRPIYALMPLVLDWCNDDKMDADGVGSTLDSVVLRRNLKAIHYLSTTTLEVLVTLVYDAPIDEDRWHHEATLLREHLMMTNGIGITALSIIGRCKGVKLVLGDDFVWESLALPVDGRVLRYKQVEDGFSNPNGAVNALALDWICSVVKTAISSKQSTSTGSSLDINMLEMYCGNGNHTVALAPMVAHLVGVELNKALCAAARENLSANGISNAHIVACDSNKFARSILRSKQYHCKENGATYAFDIVLVDPPRCGLDDVTRVMITAYDYIVYISCNPDALQRDLLEICLTHRILRFAVFDQFAYTPHLECGVFLQRK